MTLSDFFAQEHGSQSRLAKSMQIAAPMLSQWASGSRPIPMERCTDIERATGGAVMRWDLRPDDWNRMWPELIGADGAPVPSTDKQGA
jgi:DNA-binding transcriptional regulator YdaS (Cro superfamily)